MITLYGIKNCDTVKKARKYLDAKGVEYKFHDFKKDSLSQGELARWLERAGCDKLLNKRGTTWRKLPDSVKESVTDDASAAAVMLDNLSVIKRPVLTNGDVVIVGFDEAVYADL